MSEWKVRDDLVLNFDWNDYDDTDRFEIAEKNLADLNLQEVLMKEGLSQKEQTKIYCEAWNQYLDDVFGDGTADKVFQGKRNRVLTTRMAKEYVCFMKRAREEAMKEDIQVNKDYDSARDEFIDFVQKNVSKKVN